MRMRERYVVRPTPDRRAHGVFDRYLLGYCTLRDDQDNLWPLEFKSRAAAEAWLNRCRRAWATGRVPAPPGWPAWPDPQPSPWA